MISFDVVSLFTSVQKDMVLKAIEDYYQTLQKGLCEDFHALLEDFIKMVEFVFNNSYFSFNNIYYQQKDGCPMESNMSSTFAYIVMRSLEKYVFSEINYIRCCQRYFDDIFMLIPKSKIDVVLGIFNSFDTRLKFTYETEINKQLI